MSSKTDSSGDGFEEIHRLSENTSDFVDHFVVILMMSHDNYLEICLYCGLHQAQHGTLTRLKDCTEARVEDENILAGGKRWEWKDKIR